jgi:hypothetical protein
MYDRPKCSYCLVGKLALGHMPGFRDDAIRMCNGDSAESKTGGFVALGAADALVLHFAFWPLAISSIERLRETGPQTEASDSIRMHPPPWPATTSLGRWTGFPATMRKNRLLSWC